MVLDHDTGLYNVHGTIMLWIQQQIATNKPASVATALLYTEAPESSLQCPRWSAYMLGDDADPAAFMGGHVGDGQHGERRHLMMEVSCWVTRENNPGWLAQLLQMVDAVKVSAQKLKATGNAIQIRDFYANANSPAALAYKITISNVDVRQPPVDPNPDIERKRVLISFTWVERQ